jgi:long-chain acyl-CoA synthetase
VLIGERLAATAARWGSREAVIQDTERLTWSQLDELADRVASGLAELGVSPGDFVAIQLPNSIAYLAAWHGILRIGATAVPLNPRYQPDELAYLLADCAAVATIAYAPLAPVLAALRARLPQLRHVLLADLSPLRGDAPPPPAAATIPFEPWVATRTATVRPWLGQGPVADDAPATCHYTSGTTGRPKGALLSHRGLLWDIDQCLRVFTATEEDRFLCVLPMFHSYAQMACVVATLATGAALVVVPQFRPDAILDVIARERISIFPGVPAYYGAMLAAARPDAPPDLRSLRLAVTGGAAMPLPVIEALERRHGVAVLEGNGPTEAGPVAYVNPEHGPRKAGSVGPPIPGVQVRIVDKDDQDVPVGEVGEVLIQAPSVMLGYLGRPEETARAMLGGWLHTGDLGRVDADGYVFLVDRKTDLIIVGGLNVYPREVEDALLRHPAVAETAVVGVPEAARGERVVAFAVPREGHAPTPHELIRHCRQLLAPYKCPRHVIICPALEKNAAGKVSKLALKVQAQQELAARPDAEADEG